MKLTDKQLRECVQELTNDELRGFFIYVLGVMQTQIIGYINFYGKWEPAISEKEIFMPLVGFGVSNIVIHGREFKRFPDNKTLSDMVGDPIGFDKWCKENLK